MTTETQDKRKLLTQNLIAGTTTAVMLIPQGMAYALVAGMDPIHGLYASLLPLFVYALIGRSRELAVGPGALDTLIVGTTLSGLAFVTKGNYAIIAAILTLQVAAIQLILGMLRFGFLVNFLSRPVISGFTSAAALIIGFSQMRHLFGYSAPKSAYFYELLWQTIKHLPQTNIYTALIGIGSIILLTVLKKMNKMFPRALAVTLLATIIVWGLGLDAQKVAILGKIPVGFPTISVPRLDWKTFWGLLPTAFVIAFVGYLTIISIAKTFANRNRYDISANRELLAIGASNFAAAISQGFPVSASFSRSAVHASAGSTSPYTLMIAATWIGLTLAFLTKTFYYMPKAALAAIIMTAVFGLIDVQIVKHLYKVKIADMWLLIITFVATLVVGIEPGILIGVGCSLALFLYRSTRPHVAVLGRVGDSVDFRNVRNYEDASPYPGMVILRFDAQFYFGNVTFLKDLLKTLENEANPPLHTVIIEACSMTQLDSSADAALHDIADDYSKRGIRLIFASVKMPVLNVMKASGLWDKLTPQHFFMNVEDAVQFALGQEEEQSET
ncbi:MAG: sodium-independent anion transporter [Deltaproteobacteria bacterium]|nr:sodium-independent anion transporter [Deltaproteobacteria bacterium]|tara:strand:+ start:5013 stop:6680 length:1668 start_codon:yes stop_codon:yes gene_type:complete